jgi:hypothetical protein
MSDTRRPVYWLAVRREMRAFPGLPSGCGTASPFRLRIRSPLQLQGQPGLKDLILHPRSRAPARHQNGVRLANSIVNLTLESIGPQFG